MITNFATCNVTKKNVKMESVTKMAFVFVTLVTKVTIVKLKYQNAINLHVAKKGAMVATVFFRAIIFVIAATDGWEKIANISTIGLDKKSYKGTRRLLLVK